MRCVYAVHAVSSLLGRLSSVSPVQRLRISLAPPQMHQSGAKLCGWGLLPT